MRAMTPKNPCPVCGFDFASPIRDFDICPSCGTEFGIDNLDHTYDELRTIWIENGPTWASFVDPQPNDWNPWLQLIEAGYQYAIPFVPTLKHPPQSVVEGGVVRVQEKITFRVITA